MEKYREKMESANLAKNFRDNKGSYEKDEKFLAEVDTEVRFLILSFDIFKHSRFKTRFDGSL